MSNTVYNMITEEREDKSEKLKDFLCEINQVCKKYNLSISHEDGHGAFIIEEYYDSNIEWLEHAMKNFNE